MKLREFFFSLIKLLICKQNVAEKSVLIWPAVHFAFLTVHFSVWFGSFRRARQIMPSSDGDKFEELKSAPTCMLSVISICAFVKLSVKR